MKKIHLITPSTYVRSNGKYYGGKPFFINELGKFFSLTVHSRVEDAQDVGDRDLLPFDDNVKFQDFFREPGIKHFLKNIFYYRKKLLSLPEEDTYFIYYPYNRVPMLLAFFLRKRKLVIWVKTDTVDEYRNNLFKVFGFTPKAFWNILLAPVKVPAYIFVSKFLLSNNLVFYTSSATINKKDHINQHEIISCSPFNKDTGLIKEGINHNICFVGSEEGRKGLHILLKALDHPDLRDKVFLNIVGINEVGKRVNLKYLKRVNHKLHGKIYSREKFFNTLAQNDILVMSSFGEKQGKVQLEAMSVGVVPICSDSGGTYRTIDNYYNGLLFKPGDHKELREKINILYSNRKLYEELKENGLEYVKDLSLENQVEKMATIIDNFYR